MSKKILYTANTLRHLYLCHLPYLKYLKSIGYDVHTASDSNEKLDFVDKSFKLSIKRTPFSYKNLIAIFELKKIIKNNKYDIIHTHTPMGSVVTRLALILSGVKNIKIIYTAHGFHFFKGCPWINYILYYPIEKFLARFTDLIITINKEDYNFAKQHFNTTVKYIPGIGFDEDKFNTVLSEREKKVLRKSLGLNDSDYVISYVAEISKRKRHDYLLKIISKMNLTNEKFLFIGDTYQIGIIEKKIKRYNLSNIVKIIGFNNNISNFLDISDLVISVSKQEGLPLNIMEAMYKEKPIIVTDCRGNRDLIKNNVNGLVVDLYDQREFIDAINILKNNSNLATKLGKQNHKYVSKYSINSIMPKMIKIYSELMEKCK